MVGMLCMMQTAAAADLSRADFARRWPALASIGARSYTHKHQPGDPLNFAFAGSEDDLQRLMERAGWYPADPITFRSSLRITVDSLARRPYVDAPISNLYVQGRKQDLAFEQPATSNPSKRHHVRFWQVGAGMWIGGATYDVSIGITHANGHHVTHHIAADIDVERDKLLANVERAGGVTIIWINDFATERTGRNGGGDLFFTDGRLALAVAGSIAP